MLSEELWLQELFKGRAGLPPLEGHLEFMKYYLKICCLDFSEGKTGVPFVDANMRELAMTGFMSNRGRQNVASFLTKDLGLDWRMGAEWFEYLLVRSLSILNDDSFKDLGVLILFIIFLTSIHVSLLKLFPLKVDHDVCSNYGNWLYSAGIGNDPRENRKFNMIKQGLDYDNNVSL